MMFNPCEPCCSDKCPRKITAIWSDTGGPASGIHVKIVYGLGLTFGGVLIGGSVVVKEGDITNGEWNYGVLTLPANAPVGGHYYLIATFAGFTIADNQPFDTCNGAKYVCCKATLNVSAPDGMYIGFFGMGFNTNSSPGPIQIKAGLSMNLGVGVTGFNCYYVNGSFTFVKFQRLYGTTFTKDKFPTPVTVNVRATLFPIDDNGYLQYCKEVQITACGQTTDVDLNPFYYRDEYTTACTEMNLQNCLVRGPLGRGLVKRTLHVTVKVLDYKNGFQPYGISQNINDYNVIEQSPGYRKTYSATVYSSQIQVGTPPRWIGDTFWQSDPFTTTLDHGYDLGPNYIPRLRDHPTVISIKTGSYINSGYANGITITGGLSQDGWGGFQLIPGGPIPNCTPTSIEVITGSPYNNIGYFYISITE